jgi:hypothetical protein
MLVPLLIERGGYWMFGIARKSRQKPGFSKKPGFLAAREYRENAKEAQRRLAQNARRDKLRAAGKRTF